MDKSDKIYRLFARHKASLFFSFSSLSMYSIYSLYIDHSSFQALSIALCPFILPG